MKLAIALLVLLPIVFAAPQPEKRLLLADFGLDSHHFQDIVHQLVLKITSTESEVACEKECHLLVTGFIGDTGCDFACLTAHNLLVHGLHVNATTPPPTTAI